MKQIILVSSSFIFELERLLLVESKGLKAMGIPQSAENERVLSFFCGYVYLLLVFLETRVIQVNVCA